PRNPSWRYCLGLALYRDGQFDKAAQHFQESSQLDPDERRHVRTLVGLALARGRQGPAAEARRFLQEADAVMTRSFQEQAVGALPLSWWDCVEIQLLYREAQGVVHGAPGTDHPWVWVHRGRAHAALEQWDQAAADYAEAVRLRPDDPRIRMAKF